MIKDYDHGIAMMIIFHFHAAHCHISLYYTNYPNNNMKFQYNTSSPESHMTSELHVHMLSLYTKRERDSERYCMGWRLCRRPLQYPTIGGLDTLIEWEAGIRKSFTRINGCSACVRTAVGFASIRDIVVFLLRAQEIWDYKPMFVFCMNSAIRCILIWG